MSGFTVDSGPKGWTTGLSTARRVAGHRLATRLRRRGGAVPPVFRADRPRGGRARGWGFSLAELLIVVTILMILVGYALPQYQTATEQARVDLVGANLLMIYTAQRMYWVDNGTFAANIPALIGAKLLDPSFSVTATASGKYTYSTEVSPTTSATAFTATAIRTPEGPWAGSLTITEQGTTSGSITHQDRPSIVLTPSKLALGV